jgi:acetate kinase
MKILVINCGSSSLKYQLIDMETEMALAKGLVERIGIEEPLLKHEPADKDEVKIFADIPDHSVAIQMVIDALISPEHGVIKDVKEINAVGHRVVHGGEEFSSSVLITPEVKKAIEECSDIAPLHNPPNLIGIEACEKIMPNVLQVAVFDTAFHQTMPDYAFLYGIPYDKYEKYAIRRYGFHGTSHKYVSARAASLLGKPFEQARIVTCHLGNGASIAAIKGGRSIDTSMGFTPLEGLMMGTRSGDIDPAVISYLMNKEGLTAEQVIDCLNKRSGALGISGVSSDFRDIEKAAEEGNVRAQITLTMYAYKVRKYIGSYAAAMGGIDAIVFTAGIGENSISLRKEMCAGLEFLGAKIDDERNNVRGKEAEISTDDSKVKIFLIPTNEELVIARDTRRIVGWERSMK